MTRRAVRGVLATIGDTPLVELERLSPGRGVRLFAKMEKFNPGGSVKGRSVVVESSSGNLGIGIAQLCRYYGLRFVCVVDAKTTEQNLTILRAYQAEVEVVTDPDPETGEYLPVRLGRVRELLERIPHSY